MLKTMLCAAQPLCAPAIRIMTRGLARWARDTSGVVALVIAFSMPVFFAAAGVAVDLAQGYNLKTRLAGALDKAALAGGNTQGSAAEIEERIMNFFHANYPEGELGEAYDITVLTPPGMVDIHARSKTRTVFMNIFGHEYIDVFAETIVRREVTGLELVLVMDNTGSMLSSAGGSTSKIDASKIAANKLLNILFGPGSNVETLFVGVVPFSQDVNVGPTRSNWVSADSHSYSPESWAGCVEARETNNRDVTDDPPYAIDVTETTTAKFPRFYSACTSYTGNVWYQTLNPDIATNGNFSSSSGWTLGEDWAISGGLLSKAVNGANVVTNGDFAASTGWTLGSGWSVTGGQLTKSSTANSALSRTPSIALEEGVQYSVKFTVVSRSAGSVNATIGGTAGTSRSAAGTYTQTITAGSGTTVGLSTANGFKGTIDNFTVQRLPASTSAVTRSPSSSISTANDYRVTFTLVSRTAGSVRANVGNKSTSAVSTPGTFTTTLSPTSSGGTIGLSTADGFEGVVDNLIVEPLTDCGSGPTFVYKSGLGKSLGPNMYCVEPLLPMTNVKADVEAKIAAMQASGATMINLGLAWGWRMLSPRWAGMWGGVMDSTEPALPLPYDYPGMNKVIILMTDGDNTFGTNNYTAYGTLPSGRISTSQSTAETTLDNRTKNLCTTIKNKNILIYTIALGTDLTTASKTMLANCATSPAYAFVSPSTADLDNVFTTIANQLNSLHIVY
ncbi:MAG TPA: pilus assembly protein [Patescibacteria group bacterium]|nr:pilus assembly protein [Patescibacteria group bacterium]